MPLVTWEVGEGESGCRFGVEPPLECRELAPQAEEEREELVWRSDHNIQQLPPLSSRREGAGNG